jgi:hypothetical protein
MHVMLSGTEVELVARPQFSRALPRHELMS